MLLAVVAAGSAVFVPWLGRSGADTVVRDSVVVSSTRSCCLADPEVAALNVLRAWDARRAAAWATGDTAALRVLYTPSASAGDRDVAMLRAYRQRGLRVEGLETQVVRVRVVTHQPDRLVVDVVDRLAGSVAVGSEGRVRLPRGAAIQHRITFVHRAGEWRVARVIEK